MKKRIVVIGAGPGGIEAALSAAPYAQSVALISAGPVADWGQLLSSRIWLQTPERQMNSADAPIEFDLRQLGAEVCAVADAWTSRQLSRLSALNVEIVEGSTGGGATATRPRTGSDPQ